MVNQSYAQADYDSLKQKVLRMDLAVNNIHYNMKKHHDQFRSGATITAGGTALALVGIILIADRKDANTIGPTLSIAGGIGLTLGSIIMVDSHKWIGRGALKSKNLYE